LTYSVNVTMAGARKRGRPRRADGPVVTRQELIQTAARVIGREGFGGASMRGVASEAGVSLSTVQHHFKTKASLWKATIDELLVPSMTADLEAHADRPRGESLFADLIAARLESAITRPGFSGRLLTDSSESGREYLAHLAQSSEELRKTNRKMLVSMRELGMIREVDPDAITILIGIALASLSSSKHAVRELVGLDLDNEPERERVVGAITDIVLYGLLPRDRDPD
jgi:AcrR family transcriptional regulator